MAAQRASAGPLRWPATLAGVDLRTVDYDHRDAVALIGEIQQEYVRRYGGIDRTPLDPSEFASPSGLFLVGYLDGTPVACGGWRRHEGWDPDLLAGDAEIKRMYVVPSARGRGHSRTLLAELERTARAAGVQRVVLETGTGQPEAIGLYTSNGYTPIPGFGIHRGNPKNRCFAKVLAAGAVIQAPDGRSESRPRSG